MQDTVLEASGAVLRWPSAMTAPRPSAAGNLFRTPVESLLAHALDRRLDGTVVFEAPGGQKSAILLVEGVPAKARTAEPVIYLGSLLVEQGTLDQRDYDSTLAVVARERKLHGQVLFEQGLIDEEKLRDALVEQLTRKLEWLFRLPPQTAYGFYAGADFLASFGGVPTPLHPLAAIWRGVRASADLARAQAVVARLPPGPLRFHPDSAVARFQLSPKEQAVVDVLRAKPQSLHELQSTKLIAPESLQKLLYCLALTRHLDLGDGSGDPIWGVDAPSSRRAGKRDAITRPDSGARRAPTLGGRRRGTTAPGAGSQPHDDAPPSTPAEMAELKQEILDRFTAIDKQNYFEMLGLPEGASSQVVQAAFFQAAKKWHPDRLPSVLASERPKLNKIFSRLTEAHQVLMDDERRKDYQRLLKEGGASAEEQDKLQAVLRAAAAFQKAEVLLKKRDLAGAKQQAQKALEDDPEQAEYLALYAWIEGQSAERLDQGSYKDLIDMLDRALKSEPQNKRILWYRGQLLKRSGNMPSALRDFKKVLELEPGHVDAQREIRLWEMRRKSGSPARTTSPSPQGSSKSKSGGASKPAKTGINQDVGQLWGKLFKKS